MKFTAHLCWPCCTGIGAVSNPVHPINFKQREKCLSLQRLFQRFYSSCYCFLFLMKSAYFHKYVYNFLIYLSVVFCDPLPCDLSSSMCNSVVGKGKYIIKLPLGNNFIVFLCMQLRYYRYCTSISFRLLLLLPKSIAEM